MSQSQLLRKVVEVLENTNTAYMLTGSYASSMQGEPRLTHDIDLVVVLSATSVPALLASFPPPDYYLDEMMVLGAIASKGQFNLLDSSEGDKVDFWMLTDEPFDQSRFARRRTEEFAGMALYVSSPEDTILMKLRWAIMSGGSEKQFGDARSVLELQAGLLDLGYIEHWVPQLGVGELWNRLKSEAFGQA